MAAGLMAIPYEKSLADTVIENLAVDVLHHSNTKDSNNRSL